MSSVRVPLFVCRRSPLQEETISVKIPRKKILIKRTILRTKIFNFVIFRLIRDRDFKNE